MRYFSIFLIWLALPAMAQLESDVPVQLNGPPQDRRVDGIASPTGPYAALTVEATLLGVSHWANATANGNTITLGPTVPLLEYRDGQLLRFVVPSTIADTIMMGCVGLPTHLLLRPDGLVPAMGQLQAGRVCEVLFASNSWILLSSPERGCPQGTYQLSDRLCVERNNTGNLFFFPAAERCAALGGRLCSWDEFHYACTHALAEFPGMLSDWEWIDDSSNHANSAVLVGGTNCNNQTSSHPQIIRKGNSRCCFKPR